MGKSSSYNQILKSTSLFGGVQVVTILVSLLRNKIVAILLGPTGIGLIGIFVSASTLISSISGLGLNYSIVREIAEIKAVQKEDVNLGRILSVSRHWILLSAFIGLFITILLASSLSSLSFGNSDYIISFVLLSLVIFLNALYNGQRSILQGVRQLGDLARITIYSSLLSLVASIPLFYFFKFNGIIFVLIITALVNYLVSSYFFRKVQILKVPVKLKVSIIEGFPMVRLGLTMVLNSILSSGTAYILYSFISHIGGIEQVGLYNAGWGIIAQYTSVIFSAMAMDYFPRLSAVNNDKTKVDLLVNQQVEISMLLITPLMVFVLTFIPLIITILLSKSFLPVVNFAVWTVLGTLVRVPASVFSYMLLAKKDMKLYLKIEMTLFILFLFSNMIAYYYLSLEGLGISYFFNYFIYSLIYTFIVREKYELSITRPLVVIFTVSAFFLILSFVLSRFISTGNMYIVGSFIFIFSILYSLRELKMRIDLKSFFNRKDHE